MGVLCFFTKRCWVSCWPLAPEDENRRSSAGGGVSREPGHSRISLAIAWLLLKRPGRKALRERGGDVCFFAFSS